MDFIIVDLLTKRIFVLLPAPPIIFLDNALFLP